MLALIGAVGEIPKELVAKIGEMETEMAKLLVYAGVIQGLTKVILEFPGQTKAAKESHLVISLLLVQSLACGA